MNTRRIMSAMLSVVIVAALHLPAAIAQGVSISETNITISGEDVLTTEHATPVYARGTGLNNLMNRLVRVGSTVVVNDNDRGLTLTVFDATSHALVSTTNYDTFVSTTSANNLAVALSNLTVNQIAILTSADAFEPGITPSLRAEARRLGLFQLAGRPSSLADTTWRHPYAAIFHGAGASTGSHQAYEILQSNAADAPYAIAATWLIADSFVGQTVTPADYLRCSGAPGLPGPRFTDCGDGTIVDNHTGLFWLRNASCSALAGTDTQGRASFLNAFNAAKTLAAGTCGLSDGSVAGDWRLSTVEEYCSINSGNLASDSGCVPWSITDSLINVRHSSPAISNAEGNGPWSEGNPFIDVKSEEYWTFTVASVDAWSVSLSTGNQYIRATSEVLYVWPVRGSL